MSESNQPWKIWIFVILLNIGAIIGVIYLKSQGIDVYALRGA